MLLDINAYLWTNLILFILIVLANIFSNKNSNLIGFLIFGFLTVWTIALLWN